MDTHVQTDLRISQQSEKRKRERAGLARLRDQLRRQKITHWAIAEALSYSEGYIWKALHGRRRATRVIAYAKQLVGKNGS